MPKGKNVTPVFAPKVIHTRMCIKNMGSISVWICKEVSAGG